MDGVISKLQDLTIFGIVEKSPQNELFDEYLYDFTHMSYHCTSESEHAVSFYPNNF